MRFISKSKKTKVFICYRRDDTTSETSRLFQDLAHKFGKQRIFMDVDSLPPGENFSLYIERTIAACSAVIVIIGKNWLSVQKDGVPKITNPSDQVRQEIRCALQLKKQIIPVLVQNASFPQQTELPQDIRELSNLNALQLNYAYWKIDVEKLVKSLRGKKSHRSVYLLALGLILALTLIIIFFFKPPHQNKEITNTKTPFENPFQIHLFPFSPPNYDLDLTKFIFQTIDTKTSSFTFLIHTLRPLATVHEEKSPLRNEKGFGEPIGSIHTDTILKELSRIQSFDKTHGKEVLIALIPYSLNTSSTMNLFSIRADQYAAISTIDWQFQEYQAVSIYRYLVHQIMKTAIVALQPPSKQQLKYHPPDFTLGCVFDYHYEKTAIKNAIANGTICDEHQQIIKTLFGERVLNEFKYIIAFQWLDKETMDKINRLYRVAI